MRGRWQAVSWGPVILAGLMALEGCVPNQAFKVHAPVASYNYALASNKNYFFNASADVSFVEFLKDGSLANANERDQAYAMIDSYRKLDPKSMIFVFLHGWKNDASEASGNVWGFRRTLDFLACLTGRPVLGIYIGWPGVGWPGQNGGFAENLSFSDRESVAYQVGSGAVRGILTEIIRRTKGANYDSDTTLILMGHSFGGLVMEEAITPLIKARIDSADPNVKVASPVDLLLLINEAAPAQLARPFLYYLKNQNVSYKDDKGQDYPLIVSMTSVGDAATKFAFPGGQFISPHKPKLNKIVPKDMFGIDSEKTYYLLTTANTVALQNRVFVERGPKNPATTPPGAFVTLALDPNNKNIYDFVPLKTQNPKLPVNNDTPYWVAQLPQVFVPDHGSVFGYQFMRLLNEFVSDTHYSGSSAPVPLCAAGAGVLPPPPVTPLARTAPTPAAVTRPKIMLEKRP